MILSICAYLDDTSYVYLFITNKRYFHLLRSETFLRTLFRDRRVQELTLFNLRRGLYNIIHSPTVTYIGERKLHNHYLHSDNDNVLLDMFERISLIRDGTTSSEVYHSSLHALDGKIAKYRGGYVFPNHENALVVTDKDLVVTDTIPNINKCGIYNIHNETLVFRRTDGAWYIYRQKREPLMIEPVLLAQDISAMAVDAPFGREQVYDIKFIIDADHRLIHRNRVVASNIKQMTTGPDHFYMYLTQDKSLYMVVNAVHTLVAHDVDRYYASNRNVICYLSGEVMYSRINNIVKTMATDVGEVYLSNTLPVYYHKSSHLISWGSGNKKIDNDVIVKSFSVALHGQEKYLIITSPELL